MSSNYGSHVSTKSTPQTQPIFGRTDQVKNNAGGYVFKISDQHLLERFLLIGSEGGTFYVSEAKLTVENAKTIVEMIKNDGLNVLKTLKELVTRAPKRDPSIFVLALVTTYGNQEVKSEAYKLIKDICKTSTHLFTFVQNIQDLRGWSRGLKTGVANFYLSRTPEQIAYQLVKYRQRNGWTHRDVIRLSHPKTKNQAISELFCYATAKEPLIASKEFYCDNELITAFETVQKVKELKDLIPLIKNHRLTWEMLPTSALNHPEILEALLQDMPMTAMIRNLNRMTKAGLFESNLSDATKLVTSRLTNKELLSKAGLHPVNILNSMKTYAQGRGQKGSLTWTPNQAIVDALDEAFQLSFQTIKPTGKNILVAVDISGSMDANVANMSLNAREIAAALSLSLVKTEPNVDLIWFDTKCYKPAVGKRSSYEEVIKNTPYGGGTDCSLAYSYALNNVNTNYDAVIILTDNETWAGKQHAVQLFERYNKINPNAKHIVIGMSANQYSILTDKEPNVLHIAGFDAAIPEFVSNFIKG